MTIEEEIYYTLSANDNTYDLPHIEAETVRANRLEINTNYFRLRGMLTFGEALKESAIPVIARILKAAPVQQPTAQAQNTEAGTSGVA